MSAFHRSNAFHKPIQHPFLSRPIKIDRQLVSLDLRNIAVAELDVEDTGAEIIQFLPRARSTPASSNLPLPAALYSRGQNSLPFGKFAQASLDLVAILVWVILPLAFWGAVGLLAFALFFT